MLRWCLFLSLATAVVASSTPNPIYDASQYTTVVDKVPNGILYAVRAPESTHLPVLHVFGTAKERGMAQGQLLGDDILDFVENKLDEFYREEVDSIPLGLLPEWLQKAIKGLGKDLAPAAFHLALGFVWDEQLKYNSASAAGIVDEIAGMAAGICMNRTSPYCHEGGKKLTRTLEHVNMLPELIRMQCSMMGAWGKATPNGKLVQLRSLDFGAGPFANRSLLVVHHPPSPAQAFASLGFPALVGIVTGFSESISQCEKVDDVSGGHSPKGTYAGQAATMVIRDMVQFAKSKEEAVAIAQKAHRTWPVWLGLGDYSSQEFVAMLYEEASANTYTDKTLPTLTNQTQFDDVAYLDKHPQPSEHPDMPALVAQYYGNITPDIVASYFPRLMESGDVHIAVYDFQNNRTLIATGTTDAVGQFTRFAHEAPFLQFDNAKLWSEPAPPAPPVVCAANQFCCPEAKHCLTPSNVSCADSADACSPSETCCPVTKICVTVGKPCESPCSSAKAYCCPEALHCLTPNHPGKFCGTASACSPGSVCCPITNLCTSIGAPCVPP